MKKNNSVMRKLSLSILFVLVLGVMIFFGVSNAFKNVKSTMAISSSDCTSAGGKIVTQKFSDGSSGTFCCESGYTKVVVKDYETQQWYCINTSSSLDIRVTNGWNDVSGIPSLAWYNPGNGKSGYTYTYRIEPGYYQESTYFKKHGDYWAKINNAFDFCPTAWSVWKAQDVCALNSGFDITKKDCEGTGYDEYYEEKFKSNTDCYNTYGKIFEEKNLCDSLWGNDNPYWITTSCAYDATGKNTKNLYCDCRGSLKSVDNASIEGAACYKQSNSTYSWMLKTNATSTMVLQSGVNTASDCSKKNTVQTTTYTIKYDANGGNVSKTSDTGKKSSTITLPTPTKSGYTFKGWYTAADGGTLVGKSGASYTISGNKTLYAQWTKNSSSGSQTPTETKYTVKFDTDGGSSVSSKTGKSGTEFSLPSTKKSGYEFNGWYTSNGGFVGTTGDTYTIHSNVTLKAKWTLEEEEEKENTYNVSFKSNGGILSESSASCTTTDSSCEIDDLPEATREGYIFLGWSKTSSCNSYDEEVVLSSKNEKRYACWDKEEVTYAVTFNSNGGFLNGDSQMSCKTKDETCEIDNLPTAELEGHTFTGWGTNSLCAYGNKETLTLDRENATYYACFLKNQAEPVTYEVEFYDGTEKIHYAQCTINEGEALCKVNVPEYSPEVENKLFTGWGISETCTSGSKKMVDVYKDTTYYACYLEYPDTTIEEDGGSAGLTILYIVLFLGVVGAGGYFGWKFLKSKNNNNI